MLIDKCWLYVFLGAMLWRFCKIFGKESLNLTTLNASVPHGCWNSVSTFQFTVRDEESGFCLHLLQEILTKRMWCWLQNQFFKIFLKVWNNDYAEKEQEQVRSETVKSSYRIPNFCEVLYSFFFYSIRVQTKILYQSYLNVLKVFFFLIEMSRHFPQFWCKDCSEVTKKKTAEAIHIEKTPHTDSSS